MIDDTKYMNMAIELAKQAADEGEVPVGAVIVCDGNVIGTGRNRRETDKNALAHAEIEAINNACKAMNGWRLSGCTMYVTLEPCPMCAGAIINSRIKRVVYGTRDDKAGSCGSIINLFGCPYNHHPSITVGVLEEQCTDLLKDFFKNLRDRRETNA